MAAGAPRLVHVSAPLLNDLPARSERAARTVDVTALVVNCPKFFLTCWHVVNGLPHPHALCMLAACAQHRAHACRSSACRRRAPVPHAAPAAVQLVTAMPQHHYEHATGLPVFLKQLRQPRRTAKYLEFARHPRPLNDRERNHPPLHEHGAYMPQSWRQRETNLAEVRNGYFPDRTPQVFKFRFPEIGQDPFRWSELMDPEEPFPF